MSDPVSSAVKFVTAKNFMTVVGAILATGVLLNMANNGTFGSMAQNLANKVTNGYGK